MTTERSVRVSNVLFAEGRVIPSRSDRSRAENIVEIMSIEHVPVDFDALVPQSWVMKCTKNVIHHLIHWYSWMLPGVDNPPNTY
jgi:hypothetical protein